MSGEQSEQGTIGKRRFWTFCLIAFILGIPIGMGLVEIGRQSAEARYDARLAEKETERE